MKRKKGNAALWSVPRVRDPRFPGWTVRVTELRSGGTLYACFRRDGKQTMRSLGVTRKDLGSTAKKQQDKARALALDVIEALATPTQDSEESAEETPEVLTLGTLADLYEREGLHGAGLRYATVQVKKVRRFADFLGADRPVVSLCQADVKRFAANRAKDGVGRNTIHGDVRGLKIALNFATEYKRVDGRTLLDRNPLQKVRVPREEPKRPWATPERYEQLRAVADQLPPAFACVLSLAWETARRIGAILALRWQDVSFESTRECPDGSIRWYAGVVQDKKKHDEIVPLNALALLALERWREQSPGIGPAWLFTAPTNPSKPLGQFNVARWLRQAEELAGLEHEPGGAWHAFRRGWATVRKHEPLVDVAQAGGWRDTATLMRCYTHADPKTTYDVIAHRGG